MKQTSQLNWTTVQKQNEKKKVFNNHDDHVRF